MGSWCSIDLAYTKESRRSEKGVHKIQNNFFYFFCFPFFTSCSEKFLI